MTESGGTTLRIAVLHHDGSFFPLELRSQVADAAELVWVVDSTTDAPEIVRLVRRLGPTVDVADSTLDETAATLGELGVRGVVSFVDDHIVTAAELAQRLGLPFHTVEVAHLVTNKQAQRAALARAGVPGPAFWPIPADLSGADLAELAATITYPAVVKAAEGSGSRHMHLVHDAEELVAGVAASAAASPTGFLVEEYLVDEISDRWYASYLSVESVVSGGVISHVALTGRFPLSEPFRESGNFIPAVVEEPEAMFELAERTIRALGITDSITHTEIKLTPRGPRVIEVNGRLGGRPPFVLTKVAPVNLFQVACQVAAGVPVVLDGPVHTEGVGFWLMLHAPMAATILLGVDGTDAAAALPGVDSVILNRPPDTALDWREGTDAKVVTVQGVRPDHTALEATVAEVRRAVSIVTDAD